MTATMGNSSPLVRCIVTNEIRTAVCPSQFEVPVVWRQPRVESLRDGDATVSKHQCAWRLLAAMACVAFDANGEEPLVVHPVTIRPRGLRKV